MHHRRAWSSVGRRVFSNVYWRVLILSDKSVNRNVCSTFDEFPLGNSSTTMECLLASYKNLIGLCNSANSQKRFFIIAKFLLHQAFYKSFACYMEIVKTRAERGAWSKRKTIVKLRILPRQESQMCDSVEGGYRTETETENKTSPTLHKCQAKTVFHLDCEKRKAYTTSFWWVSLELGGIKNNENGALNVKLSMFLRNLFSNKCTFTGIRPSVNVYGVFKVYSMSVLLREETPFLSIVGRTMWAAKSWNFFIPLSCWISQSKKHLKENGTPVINGQTILPIPCSFCFWCVFICDLKPATADYHAFGS